MNRTTRQRIISKSAYKSLDAPGICQLDESHVIDWSGPVKSISKFSDGRLCVALGSSAYVWDPVSSGIERVAKFAGKTITCVKWRSTGTSLVFGMDTGEVFVWIIAKQKTARSYHEHSQPITCIEASGSKISSGCLGGKVYHYDMKKNKRYISKWTLHKGAIHSLAWNHDKSRLAVASADGTISIWGNDLATLSCPPRWVIKDLKSAVTTVQFCPWKKNLLGCGTSDGQIGIYDIGAKACIHKIDSGSPVSGFQWCSKQKEFVTSHSGMRNPVLVWRYHNSNQTPDYIAQLYGHKEGIIALTQNFSGNFVCTAGKDEQVKIWEIRGNERDSVNEHSLASKKMRL